MEVHNLPFAIPAVPDAGLLGLCSAGDPSRVHVLRDADVGNAGRLISHQVDVGVQDRGVHGLAVPRPHWRGDKHKWIHVGEGVWVSLAQGGSNVGRGDTCVKHSA